MKVTVLVWALKLAVPLHWRRAYARDRQGVAVRIGVVGEQRRCCDRDRGVLSDAEAGVVRRYGRLVSCAACRAEDHVHPVVGGTVGAGGEQIAGTVGVDAIVAGRCRERAIGARGGEVVAGSRVMAVAVVACHVGGSGGDCYRVTECHGLPATRCFIRERRGCEQGARAGPQRAGVGAGVVGSPCSI